MPATAVIDLSLGDTGKSSVVHWLCNNEQHRPNAVVRFQGGSNSGKHLVTNDPDGNRTEYRWHLLPSGILHEEIVNVLGPGMVIDLEKLAEEIRDMEKLLGRPLNLVVSKRAHVVLPSHKYKDTTSSVSSGKVGSTGRGIGPAYETKMERTGLQVQDLSDANRVAELLAEPFPFNYHHSDTEVKTLLSAYHEVEKYLGDTVSVVNEMLRVGDKVMLEGAQGTLLDISLGGYPYVTSSSCTAGGACSGSGVSPVHVNSVIGVTKAYVTRVDGTQGSSPFPTEIDGELASELREKGKEYGVTTGRPRRIGWLDLVALKYAVTVNGCTSLALTKLDVLNGLKEVKVCVGYEGYDSYPTCAEDLKTVTPIYQILEGWEDFDASGYWRMDWPNAVRWYLNFIEEFVGCRIRILSYGPHDDDTYIANTLL